VETGTRIAIAVLASSKLPEVFCSFGYYVIIQPENDTTSSGTVDGDFELQEKSRREQNKNKISASAKGGCCVGMEHVRRRWTWLLVTLIAGIKRW
jgi:hypothetical protein